MPEPLSDRFDFEKLFTVPNSEPLPSDGVSDDRTDAGLIAREQSYRQADDLNWLLEGTEPAVTEGGPAIDIGGGTTAVKPKGQPLRIAPEGLPGMAGAIATDMGMGAVEAPRQAVGGMRDAVQSIIDIGEEVDRWKSLGGITFTDEEGNLSIDYKNADEWRALVDANQVTEPDLPTVSAASTVTGGGIRAITQFMRSRRV